MTAPEDLDDLAAELDETDDSDPVGATDLDLDLDLDLDSDTLTGVCVGGPYAGRTLISRCPRGVLLLDRPTNRAWLYDWVAGGFVSRHGLTPMSINDADRWRAAEEPDYDVMAYDAEVVPL